MYYIVLPVCEDYAGKTMSSKREKFQRYFGSSLLLTLPTLTSSSFFFFFLLASLLMIFSQFLSACVCVPTKIFSKHNTEGKETLLIGPAYARTGRGKWLEGVDMGTTLSFLYYDILSQSLSLSLEQKKKKKKLTPVVGFTPQCPVVCVCV